MDEAEAILISGQEKQGTVLTYFHKFGIKVVVIKRGEQGALVSWSGGIDSVPAVKTAVVDTVGAGDAFAAGFLAGYIRGFDPPKCASMRCVMGKLCVRAEGPLQGTLDKAILKKALKEFDLVPG